MIIVMNKSTIYEKEIKLIFPFKFGMISTAFNVTFICIFNKLVDQIRIIKMLLLVYLFHSFHFVFIWIK